MNITDDMIKTATEILEETSDYSLFDDTTEVIEECINLEKDKYSHDYEDNYLLTVNYPGIERIVIKKESISGDMLEWYIEEKLREILEYTKSMKWHDEMIAIREENDIEDLLWMVNHLEAEGYKATV